MKSWPQPIAMFYGGKPNTKKIKYKTREKTKLNIKINNMKKLQCSSA